MARARRSTCRDSGARTSRRAAGSSSCSPRVVHLVSRSQPRSVRRSGWSHSPAPSPRFAVARGSRRRARHASSSGTCRSRHPHGVPVGGVFLVVAGLRNAGTSHRAPRRPLSARARRQRGADRPRCSPVRHRCRIGSRRLVDNHPDVDAQHAGARRPWARAARCSPPSSVATSGRACLPIGSLAGPPVDGPSAARRGDHHHRALCTPRQPRPACRRWRCRW